MDDLSTSSHAKWVPPLEGMLAASLVSSLVCGPRRPHSLYLSGLFLLAASCTLATFVASVAAVRIACAVVFIPASSKARRVAVQTTYAAVWFAPLSLLLQAGSTWSVPVAVILAVAATVPFLAYQNASAGPLTGGNATAPPADEILRPLDAPPFFQQLAPALWAALLVEIAAVAVLANQLLLAAICAAGFSALLVWSFSKRVWREDERARRGEISKARKLLLVTLAVLFTSIGLLPYLRSSSGPNGGQNASANFSSGHRENQASAARRELIDTRAGDLGGGYPGIILWPKTQQSVTLIAPVPRPKASSFSMAHRTEVLSIPFDGVYWYFKAAEKHPLKGAHVAHGSPTEFNIRSTDGRPLLAEAHQNLGSPISLACCKGIQIEIRNADHYPGTVSVELVVRNTKLTGEPALSLGTVAVSPAGPWKLFDDRPPVNEILTFAISEQSSLLHFDEFTVVFRLTPDRSLLAAKIGIERFILVPRGF